MKKALLIEKLLIWLLSLLLLHPVDYYCQAVVIFCPYAKVSWRVEPLQQVSSAVHSQNLLGRSYVGYSCLHHASPKKSNHGLRPMKVPYLLINNTGLLFFFFQIKGLLSIQYFSKTVYGHYLVLDHGRSNGGGPVGPWPPHFLTILTLTLWRCMERNDLKTSRSPHTHTHTF